MNKIYQVLCIDYRNYMVWKSQNFTVTNRIMIAFKNSWKLLFQFSLMNLIVNWFHGINLKFFHTLVNYGKNFVKSTTFKCFHDFFQVSVNSAVFPPHSVEKWKIWSHWKNISSNQLYSNLFSKNVTFTKFLPKKCETKVL